MGSEASVDMDFYAVLAELAAERKRVDTLIRTLEALQNGYAPPEQVAPKGRRGRKSMGAEERLEVSLRMQRYWEARRKAKHNVAPAGGDGAD